MPNTQTLEISALFSGSSNDYFRVCKQIADVLNEESGFVAVGHPAMAEQHQRAGRLTKFFNLADDVKLSMATTNTGVSILRLRFGVFWTRSDWTLGPNLACWLRI